MLRIIKRIGISLSVISFACSGHAAVALIESFEITSDPPAWQNVSPANQTVNAANDDNANVPLFSLEHETEGLQSGEFRTTWTLPGVTATGNPHVSGDPLQFWSVRFNAGTPAAFLSNSINVNSGLFQADVFNDNPYPLAVAFVFDNTLVTNQLKRGPFMDVPANSGATYSWDMQDPLVWVTGGSNDWSGGTNARLRSMLLYTTSTPTMASCQFFVDNIRDANAQTDVTPPAPPVLYSARQGQNPGDLIVSWKANTEVDLDEYRVFQASDANFNSITTNRLVFPTTPVATVPAGTNQVTLTGVPTDQNVYVTVRAVDDAAPAPNTSEAGVALGARLRSDGGPVDDHVVLDLNRNQPGSAEFTLEGYLHAIVYNGRALESNSRYYDSVSATAIDDAAETLVVSPTGITIWSNLLDGSGSSSVALTTASVSALTTFYNNEGNLLISGAGIAEDLATRGPSQQAFLTDQLQAELLSANIGDASIIGTNPLPNMGTVFTDADNFTNNSAYNSGTSSDQLTALSGAAATGQFSSQATPTAGVVHGNQVVFLGFSFESIAGADITASETARANLLQDSINYLLGSQVKTWSLY